MEWIMNNKEWLFSGIGVTLLFGLLGLLLKKKQSDKNKQKIINSGNNFSNIQGENVIVNQQDCLSYSEVRQIALDVFKGNFYELSEEAKTTAVKRAEQLIDKFLFKLQSEPNIEIGKIKEPDIQYVVINAQKIYARSGQPETLELLTDILKKRFQVKEDSLKGIVLNEAIDTLSKLTIKQIKAITALFLVKNCKVPKARNLIEALSAFLTDELIICSKDQSFFEHLIFAGVATNDVTTNSSQNLEYFIRINYSDELKEKVEGNTLDILDPPIRKQFKIDLLSESIFDKWNNSLISRYSLTSVGIAIAVAHYNAVMGTNLDLNIWIKG